MLETETLLEKCPSCGAWPMANLERTASAQPEVHFNWKPETDLSLAQADDGVASHALVGGGARVRVIPADEHWPIQDVRSELKDGWAMPPTGGKACR